MLPSPEAGNLMEIILLYIPQDIGKGCNFGDRMSDYTISKFNPLQDSTLVLPTCVWFHRDTKAGLKLGRLRIWQLCRRVTPCACRPPTTPRTKTAAATVHRAVMPLPLVRHVSAVTRQPAGTVSGPISSSRHRFITCIKIHFAFFVQKTTQVTYYNIDLAYCQAKNSPDYV